MLREAPMKNVDIFSLNLQSLIKSCLMINYYDGVWSLIITLTAQRQNDKWIKQWVACVGGGGSE